MRMLTLLLIGAVVATGCSKKEDGGAPAKYESPEKVFDAAKQAAEKDDYKTLYNCLTPETQEEMVAGMAFAGMMLKSFSELAPDKTKMAPKQADTLKKINDAFAKHGLTEEWLKTAGKPDVNPTGDRKSMAKSMAKFLEPIKDKAGFFADVFGAMAVEEKPVFKSIKDVKVDGDTATAKVTVTQKSGDKESVYSFKKVDGGWRMAPPEKD